MPPLLQVLTLLFAMGMAYLTYVGFRRRQFGRGGLALWELIWLALLLASIVPLPHQWLSRVLGAARLLDLAIVVALLLMFVITYRTYVTVQRLRRQLEELVRRQALAQIHAADTPGLRPQHPSGSA